MTEEQQQKLKKIVESIPIEQWEGEDKSCAVYKANYMDFVFSIHKSHSGLSDIFCINDLPFDFPQKTELIMAIEQHKAIQQQKKDAAREQEILAKLGIL